MRQQAAHNRIETAISTVPPDAPEEVVALSTRFSQLHDRYNEQREQRKDASKHERYATTKTEAARLQEEALLVALDQAGEELAEAILAAHDGWAARVRDQLAADIVRLAWVPFVLECREAWSASLFAMPTIASIPLATHPLHPGDRSALLRATTWQDELCRPGAGRHLGGRRGKRMRVGAKTTRGSAG